MRWTRVVQIAEASHYFDTVRQGPCLTLFSNVMSRSQTKFFVVSVFVLVDLLDGAVDWRLAQEWPRDLPSCTAQRILDF